MVLEKIIGLNPRFYSYNGSGLCGVAAIRSVLVTQFKKEEFEKEESERDILRMVYDFYRQRYGEKPQPFFKKHGVSPSAMANCLKKMAGPAVKIFCSKKGNVEALDYLLEEMKVVPVVHYLVAYPGDRKPGGHYLLFAGAKKERIKIFDPSPGEGLKEYPKEEFLKDWFNKDERWFLAALPPEKALDQRRFNGKYL